MFRKLRLAALAPLFCSPVFADGFTEAAGVNLSADEGFGARHSGMGTSFADFQRDANAVVNAPAGMNDVDDFAFATAHAEKFGEAKFDDFAFLFPFEGHSTLGLGLSRYGVSGIDLRPDGVTPLESQPVGQFSIADYLVVAGFARRWGGDRFGVLDVGADVNLLYRQLDQDGFGMRGDAMAQYTWEDQFRVSALLKGLLPSAAKWESGYSEYEPTDLLLGAAARFPAPYFYGTLEVAYQTQGLFQKEAKSQTGIVGSRLYESPLNILSTSKLGAEFLFDFGLSLRFGFTELDFSNDPASLTTFGIGYNWRGILGLDYSFTPHPDLLASHRISLQFTPAFPKFNGRSFRRRGAARPLAPVAPAAPAVTPSLPAAPAPQAAPADTTQPSLPAQTPATKPATPEKKPAPNGGEKEILEQDDDGK